jgi:hypothetical protein
VERKRSKLKECGAVGASQKTRSRSDDLGRDFLVPKHSQFGGVEIVSLLSGNESENENTDGYYGGRRRTR